ncbi:MAG: DUF6282 family protein, partial [Chloroflexi bacterium]|nr:DUF6282 family protein [Chloroflexota bacterium]
MSDQVNELLRGGIDLHTHAGPGLFLRVVDDIQLAEQAREAGMKGVLIKAHEGDTTYRAVLAAKVVPGIEVMGAIVLNHFVGGLNPSAVDLAVKTGAKMVWMPTLGAKHHADWHHGRTFDVPSNSKPLETMSEPIRILTDTGKLRPEVQEIIRLIAGANVAFGTGHLSPPEISVLAEGSRETGLRKIIITHPDLNLTSMPLSQQVELARKGAFIEKIRICTTPRWGNVPVAALAASIREIGAERCIIT